MLAVLNAGATVVVLDASHPVSRYSLMISGVSASLILVGERQRHLFSERTEQDLVVDAAFIESLPSDQHLPTEESSGSDIASVIYTSGSTGVPKGSLLSHSAVSTSMDAHGCALNIGSSSRVLQFASDSTIATALRNASFTARGTAPSERTGQSPSLSAKACPATCGWLNRDKITPVGCAGELLVEGPLVSVRYLNDGEKTRQSFIEDPSWALINGKRTGRRFYKTVDLVRYTTAGSLDYRGRKDHQLKIHGQHAEIGGIEHQLLRGGEFEHGLVLLPESGAVRQCLVAVVSPTTSSSGNDSMQLVTVLDRAHASSQLRRLRSPPIGDLPSYMNPSVWCVVSSIALNTLRKMDRKLVSRWVKEMDKESLQEANTLAADDERTAAARNDNEAQLQQLVAEVLNRSHEQILLNRSFVSLGGDSITAMQLVARARATTERAVSLAEEKPDMVFPLTPVQHMYFKMSGQQPTHFNQSFFLRITRPLVARRSMLRARFHKTEDNSTFTQLICGEIEGSFRYRGHEQLDRPAVAAVMGASERTLDITSGPVFSADYFDSPGKQLLFLRILMQELQEYLQSGRLADTQPSVSFQSWSCLPAQYAGENLSIESVLPSEVPTANIQYWGLSSRENSYATASRQSFTLSAEHTSALLGSANQAYNTDPVDLFVASLMQSFAQTFRVRETPSVFLEGHGREPMDPPLICPALDIVETVRRLKDRRRQLLSNVWQYSTARYLARGSGTGNAFPDHLPMEVLFNYMGQYQQLERTDALLHEEPRIDLPGLEDITGDVTRLAFFEVSAVINNGIARFDFTFSDQMRHQTKISHWIETFQETLTEAATRLASHGSRENAHSLDRLRKGTLADAGLLHLGVVEEIYLYSPMQQGLLLSQSKSDGIYQLRFTFDVSSKQATVTAQELFDAWQQVVDRQPILRTFFVDAISPNVLFEPGGVEQARRPHRAHKGPSPSSTRRRFYKTGDLVHYYADGTLQYLGRKDSQVKVAVELVQPPGRADRTLAAFICFSETISVDQESSDRLLLPMTDSRRSNVVSNLEAQAHAMPAYMIPTFFVPLHHLPLNLSAKTDRSKLRRLLDHASVKALQTSCLASETPKQPPSSPLESRLDTPLEPSARPPHTRRSASPIPLAAREGGLAFSGAELFQAQTIAQVAKIAEYISEDDRTSGSDSVELLTLIDDAHILAPSVGKS
ncbi:acetyl-CoA synthetase-like protein [Aspergillus homomorphus CBS 101889]|uniref:Acetyl-CoA synthetase-like protein n=1 Tax=Aspergillus homomorphus (strain CBS 101889) TaxID=1450537 RepID=A0A395HM08_ASPHC|nr:acetyl-CoA synthetase-like protein [Aspergillus homomorphus CBS 101889]RAL08800.1 acetyl-CoA synthetase-like protein [Aspergillus homomorphus CBS 101889]